MISSFIPNMTMPTFTFNGHTYEVITTPMNWSAARAYAASNNAYLAVINSQAENEAIFTQVAPLLSSSPVADDGGGSAYVWLGASDTETEGSWVWVDGTPLQSGYTNWGSGFYGTEPDDYAGQDAMGMGLEVWPQGSGGYGVAGQWNDIDENNAMFFVMESSPPIVNPPPHIIESSVSYTLKADDTALKLTGTSPLIGKGNANPNTLTGNDGNNKLYGLEGDDLLQGGLGNDVLEGGAGNDMLDGGAGTDKLAGGQGDDVYLIDDSGRNGKAADTITEKAGQGNDTVRSSISFTLSAEVETLVLTQSADSQATGNKGSNTIAGNGGANLIDGKEGNDTLTGGEGADRFVFSTKLNGVSNVDVIQDFTAGADHLVLSKKIFSSFGNLLQGQSPAEVALTLSTATPDANDRLIYDSRTGALAYDPDGSGVKVAVIFAVLVGAPVISASDFWIA